MLRSVKCAQRNPRLIGFKVTGTGTAVITQGSTEATLVDNGTGDYTLTFVHPFSRAVIPVATPLTADCVANITAASSTAVTVKTFDATDGTTAKDAVFFLHVLGYDSIDET